MENSIDILPNDSQLNLLIESISEAIKNARTRLASHINTMMTETYWQIGKYIVEYEQGGAAKVAYGHLPLPNYQSNSRLVLAVVLVAPTW